MNALYIHCPFCVSKCHYCDFYSVADGYDLMDAFVDAVTIEAQPHRGKGFQTVYLGGGTPSLLGAKRLDKLMGAFVDIFDLGAISEGTIEVNPESASPAVLQTALASGLDRISIGVQSLSDRELQSIGRIHTRAQAIEAVSRAGETGFQNVSADLMIGLPGQDWPSLRESLATLIELDVKHISAYCLSVEPGTQLGFNQPQDLPSDDRQAELFEAARSLLIGKGFCHYEISNFALGGFECRHNLNYWRGGEYLGLGPAAASHLCGRRYRNRADLRAYLVNPSGQVEDVEQLSPGRKAAEEAILRLRLLSEGVASDVLVSRYGEANARRVIRALDDLTCRELLMKEGSIYRLVPSRVLTSNPIFASLLG